jgi:D-glycero-D-manno-heptose 1,7-bisphosphate phosphatase
VVTRRAVFLDRDGVLNEARVRDGRPHPPNGTDDLVLLPGVEEACKRLARHGWLLVIVTNQPDVARGTRTRDEVDAINREIASRVGIDEIMVCPHDDDDDCSCRKPMPGLLLDAARRLDIDLEASVMVGDRWRDVGAGRKAGVRTIFVDRGYSEEMSVDPDDVVGDLPEAVDLILAGADVGADSADARKDAGPNSRKRPATTRPRPTGERSSFDS